MNQAIADFIVYLQKLGITADEPTASQIMAYVEQKEANRNANLYRREGQCPTCGHSKTERDDRW